MSATAKAQGPIAGFPGNGTLYREARRMLRSLCPQAVLNWREARYYARYGEVELHLLEFLCHRDRDAIDVGANDGSYVHYLRRYAQRVIAFEPMPALAHMLRRKFRRGVVVESLALSDAAGRVSLCMPVVDGAVVNGCSTISSAASAVYPAHRAIKVPMDRLDNVYGGDVGFIKIDVEGHQQAVLDGAVATIRRCQPRSWSKPRSVCRRADWRAPRPISSSLAIAATTFMTDISSRSISSRLHAYRSRRTCPT